MPQRKRLDLTEAQRHELKEMRDHAHPAYLRERAAAILKVAAGHARRQVARHGLLKEHSPDTVGEWVRRYQQAGVEGLRIRAGRGRKPAFFPSERA